MRRWEESGFTLLLEQLFYCTRRFCKTYLLHLQKSIVCTICLICELCLRHGIVAMSSPRMTAKDATHSEIHPFERTVLAERLDCILRASWGVAARRRSEGGDEFLIEADGKNEQSCHRAGNGMQYHSMTRNYVAVFESLTSAVSAIVERFEVSLIVALIFSATR